MVVKSSPSPVTYLVKYPFLVGLALLFLGERAFGTFDDLRAAVSGIGLLLVLMSTGLRAARWAGAKGDARRVERILLLAQLGCFAALAIYLVSSDDGMRWLGIDMADPKSRARYQGSLGVLWPIVLGCSLVPYLAALWASGIGSRGGEDRHVDAYRVAELATSGLSVALAGAFLFVVCFIASDRDKKLDLSYFRTSSPGGATRNIVASLDEPLQVMLFFPAVNEVKDEVRSYFDDLASSGNVSIEEHDRENEPKLAQKYRATKDGTLVLVRGEQSEAIQLGTDLQGAREQLRTLDENVQKSLMKVIRSSRVAYLTVGHGEINDPESENPLGASGPADGAVVKQLLSALNYRVKELGLTEGLARDVPDDAAMVLVLGPRKPFADEELAALDRYLEGGGSVLIALDPVGEATLGQLEARLGVRFEKTPLADDKDFFVRSRSDADHRLIITDKFSAHASVTTLSRTGVGSGILFVNSGSLAEVPLTAVGDKPPKRTFVIKSLPTTFNDANDDYRFAEGEKRQSYNLAAAVEGPKPPKPPEEIEEEAPPDGEEGEPDDKKKPDEKKKPESKVEPHGMRALVYADSELFSDGVLMNIRLNAALVVDALRWLGGEETFSGETRSEKDVPIEHTRGQDVVWFYSTIVGGPVLVLAVGLLPIYWRRARRRRAS